MNGVGHLEDGELEAGPRTIFQEEGEVRGPSKVAKVEEGAWEVVGQRHRVCSRSSQGDTAFEMALVGNNSEDWLSHCRATPCFHMRRGG